MDVETGLPLQVRDAEKIPRCSYFRLLVSLLERCLILYLYLLSLHPTCSSPLGEKAIKHSSVSCVLVASDVRLEFKTDLSVCTGYQLTSILCLNGGRSGHSVSVTLPYQFKCN